VPLQSEMPVPSLKLAPKCRSRSGSNMPVGDTNVLDRLGIANEMKSKTVFGPIGGGAAIGILVANGKVEIGVHNIHELIPVAGIEIVGPLPGDLQATTVFAAAIMAGAKDAAASKVLVDFLRTPEAAAVIKAKGMEPANP